MGNCIMPPAMTIHCSTVGRCLTALRPIATHESPSSRVCCATDRGHFACRSMMLSQLSSSNASSQKSVKIALRVLSCHTHGRPVRICKIVLHDRMYSHRRIKMCGSIVTVPTNTRLNVCGTRQSSSTLDLYTLSTMSLELQRQ